MKLQFTSPIVGMFYRPPAKAIVTYLKPGAMLIVRPEPDNPADVNAIAVFIPGGELTSQMTALMSAEISKSGRDANMECEKELVQLGYIPKEIAADIKARFPLTEDVPGTFGINVRGQPTVQFYLQAPGD
jgi:HIRAN domain